MNCLQKVLACPNWYCESIKEVCRQRSPRSPDNQPLSVHKVQAEEEIGRKLKTKRAKDPNTFKSIVRVKCFYAIQSVGVHQEWLIKHSLLWPQKF